MNKTILLAIVQEWCDQNPGKEYQNWKCLYAMRELKEFEDLSGLAILGLYNEVTVGYDPEIVL